MNPTIYQALAIRKAMQFYVKTGIKVNRGYSPRNMRLTSKITGETYKTLPQAIAGLTLWLEGSQ